MESVRTGVWAATPRKRQETGNKGIGSEKTDERVWARGAGTDGNSAAQLVAALQ